MVNKISLNFWKNKIPSFKRKILKDVIVDRKSKYTSVWWFVESKEEVDDFMKELLKDKYFRKATHNTFAYRLKLENWTILESKNDDQEAWAWNCILRELQRVEALNIIIVITRYFWWIQLHADRFKNVINATKIMLDKF
jgi:putative IMPACT (imprinted ancient) family translation regulator